MTVSLAHAVNTVHDPAIFPLRVIHLLPMMCQDLCRGPWHRNDRVHPAHTEGRGKARRAPRADGVWNPWVGGLPEPRFLLCQMVAMTMK